MRQDSSRPLLGETTGNLLPPAGAALDLVPARDSLLPADASLLRLGGGALRGVALRAMAAGEGGATMVGVAGLQHGDGATTVARNLAVCLAEDFGKRVVLVEANQRSASLRRAFGLPDGPGLADVLARRISLGGVLQMADAHRQVVLLPAAMRESGLIAADDLRALLVALLAFVDAAVVDLAPVVPYKDTVAACRAVDGMVMVMRAGSSTIDGSRMAMARLQDAGGTILGGVLNRQRSVVPFSRRRVRT